MFLNPRAGGSTLKPRHCVLQGRSTMKPRQDSAPTTGPGAKALSEGQAEHLLGLLEARFAANPGRHKGLEWAAVETRLKAAPAKLWSLQEMERTGGEPDVVGLDKDSGEYLFVDCSAESPSGRRSLCYDRKALEDRKEGRPETSALDLAEAMGAQVLSEAQYRNLQALGPFDLKTSSWIQTPKDIRDLGGALFADYRYGHVFVYHNGASSYYAVRGFRAILRC